MTQVPRPRQVPLWLGICHVKWKGAEPNSARSPKNRREPGSGRKRTLAMPGVYDHDRQVGPEWRGDGHVQRSSENRQASSIEQHRAEVQESLVESEEMLPAIDDALSLAARTSRAAQAGGSAHLAAVARSGTKRH